MKSEKINNLKSWTEIKDEVYGKKGSSRRDQLDRDFQAFKIGLMLREAREKRNLTQDELGNLIEKKRSYISRIENDSSNITIKTLFDLVERGLGGKIKIQIEI